MGTYESIGVISVPFFALAAYKLPIDKSSQSYVGEVGPNIRFEMVLLFDELS